MVDLAFSNSQNDRSVPINPPTKGDPTFRLKKVLKPNIRSKGGYDPPLDSLHISLCMQFVENSNSYSMTAEKVLDEKSVLEKLSRV